MSFQWTAPWIWREGEPIINDFVYFRKTFTLQEPVERAILYMSAHHQAQIYINGNRISGYGSPAPSEPAQGKLYVAYEVGAWLKAGPNTLTADVHYLGGSGQNTPDGLPGLRLELHVADDAQRNATRCILATDPSWELLVDTPHERGTRYQQNRRVSAIEHFDARKLPQGWRSGVALSTEQTTTAALADPRTSEWPMVEQMIPEGQIQATWAFECVGVYEQAVDPQSIVQVFDAGYIFSGWPTFRMRGEGLAGVTIQMRYAEVLNEQGRVPHKLANEDTDYYYDTYTFRGDDWEEWQPNFSYKAFRYLELTGLNRLLQADETLSACLAHTDLSYGGHFVSSDAYLNELYAVCIRTQRNHILGQIVDCPHREQAQYLADTDLQAEALIYNFDSNEMLIKTLQDFANAQYSDGTFPFVSPTNAEHPQFNLQIPEWDLHFASLLWKIYEQSGDEEVLRRFYTPLKRMVDYFSGIRHANGLVPVDKGWHISDWPYPSVEHVGDYLTVQQLKLTLALRITAKIAGMMGLSDEEQHYGNVATELTTALVQELYVPKLRMLRDSSESRQAHQGVTALALAIGDIIPDADQYAALEQVSAEAWMCKTVLSLPLLQLMFANGKQREAMELLTKRSYPGWGYMLQQGARTLWEGWDDIESHSHAWNGYPARLLQQYVVGIQSAAPGFSQAVIGPYLAPELDFAEATVMTPFGPLTAAWRRLSDGSVEVETVIPTGVQASIALKHPEGTASFDSALPIGRHVLRWKPDVV